MTAAGALYRDPNRPIDERVGDLLGRMTLEEKLAQLGSFWSHEILTHEAFDPAKAKPRIGKGVGQITRVAGATNLAQRAVAELANEIQRYLVEHTRLGIPAVVHEECLHGLLALESVCFPQSIGQAATWQPELVQAMASRLGRELRAAGAQQALAPILDIARDPRWGRIEETYGEDPYLVAELGAAYVRGIQGDGAPEERVVATGKHMVGHGLPEGGLNHAPSHIGARELEDAFLFPFEAAVRDAGLQSMMHAYDDVDGLPCVASKALLTDTLRGRWGFEGTVVSDYFGIDEIMTSHGMTSDRSVAAALALEAGVDIELPTTQLYGIPLAEAVAAGRVEMATVDLSVGRVLRSKFELGLFENPYVDPQAAEIPFDDDRVLAREIARQSIVLLANNGALPLRTDLRTIAVVGPNADDARNLLGDYAHVAHIEALIEMGGFGSQLPDGLTVADELAGHGTILDAIRGRVSGDTQVRFAAGCGILDGDDAGVEAAVAAAKGADVAIVVVGERSGLTENCTCGESRDRMEIDLPGRQGELVTAVAATGTPVVLVLVAGRPLAIEPEVAVSAAVVHAWVPGEEGPEALADVLFGLANPGGKLPVTVPRSVGQIPIYYGHKPSGGKSNWKGPYVDGSNLPLWPFGFGMSYTRFEVRDLRLDKPAVAIDGEFTASVEVRNLGDRAGDEVVQLYVRDEEATVTRPVKELRGFKRVGLAAGESRRISFRVAVEQLAFSGVDGRLRIEPGRVTVMAGTSSEDLPCSAQIDITGEAVFVGARSRYFTRVVVE
ncbi:MAG TPA: glycoside hydrolase family 3 N-terminal domain-containing protein [Candidatus Limnocylindrales bacterium]